MVGGVGIGGHRGAPQHVASVRAQRPHVRRHAEVAITASHDNKRANAKNHIYSHVRKYSHP